MGVVTSAQVNNLPAVKNLPAFPFQCFLTQKMEHLQKCRITKPTQIKIIKFCREAVLPDGKLLVSQGVRKTCQCPLFTEATQERLYGLIELDETALGKRKYNKGKRQRQGGVAGLQTILEVDESIGGRVANLNCVGL